MGFRPFFAFLMTVLLLTSTAARADSAWEKYKSRFLMPDGRIVDTGNGSISHTEGQGFAMLMAVANNDQQAFDKLWQWTDKTLRNKDTGLFYWRYNPVAANPVEDKNDASDGDMLIAWALLKADKQWHDKRYATASDAITDALIKHTIITFAGYSVMLPAANGFHQNDHITLNPSYFLFPAWQAFAERSHLQVWSDLQQDGQTLLKKMSFGKAALPGDWVALTAEGKLAPAQGWPPRMSYDAIRIPLYIRWADPQSALLAPWHAWFQQYSREKTPAWVNLSNNEVAPYSMSGGLLAVRDLTMDENLPQPSIDEKEDYYSASLKMLVWLAQKGQ